MCEWSYLLALVGMAAVRLCYGSIGTYECVGVRVFMILYAIECTACERVRDV